MVNKTIQFILVTFFMVSTSVAGEVSSVTDVIKSYMNSGNFQGYINRYELCSATVQYGDLSSDFDVKIEIKNYAGDNLSTYTLTESVDHPQITKMMSNFLVIRNVPNRLYGHDSTLVFKIRGSSNPQIIISDNNTKKTTSCRVDRAIFNR